MNDPLWRLLIPAKTHVIRLPAADVRRWRWLAASVRALPAGSTVALLDPAPFSRLRARRFAVQARLQLGHEYMALPSLDAALCFVEDVPESLRYFEANLVAIPAGRPLVYRLLGVCRWLVVEALPWQLVGAIVPGRLALGWRT